MKILFINLPYAGHVIPTIGLAQELIKANCEVTYLMPFDWEDKISESGAQFVGYENHRQLAEQMKHAYESADKIADQFDMILYEQFFFLGKHLAEKYHKPVVRIFTSPATNSRLMNEFISSKGPLSIFKHQWIAKAFTKDIAKNIPMKTDNWLDEIIYNPPELNLVYTLREYQPYEDEFNDSQYKFIGPSIYDRKEISIDYEKGNKPLIYISLGTVLKGKKTFFKSCIEAFRNEEIEVIISAGSFNISSLKTIPSNIHIYSSVPQLQVLKMSDVFITHGGMNSISEALVYGVPMVVIPFVSDQPVNARCVEILGAGIKMDYCDVNKDMLKNTAFLLLNNQKIKMRMNEIQNLIQNSLGNKGAAEEIIQFYKSKNIKKNN